MKRISILLLLLFIGISHFKIITIVNSFCNCEISILHIDSTECPSDDEGEGKEISKKLDCFFAHTNNLSAGKPHLMASKKYIFSNTSLNGLRSADVVIQPPKPGMLL